MKFKDLPIKDRLFANAETAASRDLIVNCGAESFATMDMAGKKVKVKKQNK